MEQNYVDLMLQEVEAELKRKERAWDIYFWQLIDDCKKYTGISVNDSEQACKELLKVGKDSCLKTFAMYNSSIGECMILSRTKEQLLKYKNF